MGIPVLYQGSLYAPVPFVPIPPDPDPAPEFVSSEIGAVNAFTLVVTFNENVSASNYSTGATIKVNGTATSITSATRQSNHAIVRYVVPVLWHGSGDAVTWEYNSATGNIVAESGGAALGDVSAQSVTNNCEYAALLDLQADTLALNDGEPVSTWADQSGQGHDFTQTGTARPTKQSLVSAITSPTTYPTVVFDGINDFMAGGEFADNLDEFSVMVICNGDSFGVSAVSKIIETSSSPGWLFSMARLLVQQDEGNFYADGRMFQSLTGYDYVFTGEFFSRTSSPGENIMINGSTSGFSTSDSFPMGSYHTTEPVRLGIMGSLDFGYIAMRSVMFFSPRPNAANRAALETRLGARYGLTVP